MSTDALLTLIGLLLAVFALLGPEQKLDLQIRISPFDIGLVLIVLVAIHLLKFQPVGVAFGMSTLGPWRWGFDADSASYLALLVTTVILGIRLPNARLHPHRIGQFRELAEGRFFSGRFDELIFLLDRYLDDLRRLIEGRHFATRLRKRVGPPSPWDEFDSDRGGGRQRLTDSQKRWRKRWAPVRGALAGLLPDHAERGRAARRLAERILLSEPFVEYLAKARPYLGLRVLEIQDAFLDKSFLDLYIGALLKNRHSVLYEETFQGQNTIGDGRFRFEQLNPLLLFFFGGPTLRADDLGLYKAVGDAVTDELKARHSNPGEDDYRLARAGFHDDGRWQSPVSLGIRLFDYLITEGLHRGNHWHLWLMYLEHWSWRIVDNMQNLPADVDDTREHPTPYHYLLWQIVSTQCSWLEIAHKLGPKLESTEIKTVDLEYGSIAKTAAVSMAVTLRIVIESPNISPKFKGYMLGVVLNGYDRLGKPDDTPLSQIYAAAVLAGGREGRDLTAFYSGLAHAVIHVDARDHYLEPSAELLDRIDAKLNA